MFLLWSEVWQAPQERLWSIEARLREKAVLIRGGDYDRWDLELWGGMLGRLRVRMANEEHGSGHQMIRFGTWPRVSVTGVAAFVGFAALATAAALDGARVDAAILGAVAVAIVAGLVRSCAVATGVFVDVLREVGDRPDELLLSLDEGVGEAKKHAAEHAETDLPITASVAHAERMAAEEGSAV